MSEGATDTFVDSLTRSGLIEKERLGDVISAIQASDPALLAEPKKIAEMFVEAKLLTPWQANNLCAGKREGFFLGRYVMLNVLGAGASGSVYLARHTHGPLHRAIKVIPFARTSDFAFVELRRREFLAFGNVIHPNLTRTLDADFESKRKYVVRDYVDGMDLRAIVEQQGPIDARSAVNYIGQVAEALDCLHSEGIVHRCVKPSSIILGADRIVRLLSTCRVAYVDEPAVRAKEIDELCGNRNDGDAWPPPARDLELGRIDIRSDISCLGWTLIYLMTGHAGNSLPAIASESSDEMRPAIPTRPFTTIPGAPADLVNLCARMTAASPRERPQTAREIADTLAALFTL